MSCMQAFEVVLLSPRTLIVIYVHEVESLNWLWKKN